MPDLAFNLDEDGKRLELTIKGSGLMFSKIDETVVREALSENFKDVCVLDDELLLLISDFDTQYATSESPDTVVVSAHIAEYRDAQIELVLTDDKMSVVAKVIGAYGGACISLRDLALAAQKSGVLKGLRKEQMIRLVSESTKGKIGQVFEREIARGRNAKHGRDTRFEQIALSAKDRILRPKTKEDGTVDMRDLGAIISVARGEVLMKRIPPTEGQHGYTVLGEEITARAGEDIQLIPGDGTAIAKQNHDVLVATKVGVPKRTKHSMVVDEILQMPAVDVKSGHVEFEGAVVVTGDVRDGMKVVAKGDVTIAGFVDSAFIESGGDVIVQQAIIGRQTKSEELTDDEELTSSVTARGEITAKYAQYSELDAGKCVSMQNQLLHCRVKTDKVWVGTGQKANGKVIGGRFRLKSILETGTLGAPAGSKIHIDFADIIQVWEAKSEALLHKINESKVTLDMAKVALDEVKKQAAEDRPKGVLEVAVEEYKRCFDEFGQLTTSRDLLHIEIEDMVCELGVKATEKLYQGVSVDIYKDQMRTAREYGPSRVFYEFRKVRVEPLIE